MRAIHFVVAIRPDQQQMADIALCDQVDQESEGGGIDPLQIVQKKHQRVLRSRERADKPPQNQVDARLRVLRRKRGNGWRLADDVAQLGNQVADEGRVRPQRLTNELAPDAELDVAR